VSGYSGRGKKGIAEYAANDSESMRSPRHYALGLAHKHVPEMHKMSGLDHPPHFMPIVGPNYAGMVVSVALHTRLLTGAAGPAAIRSSYSEFYRSEPFIHVFPENDDSALDDGFLSATRCNGTNRVDLLTVGTQDLVAVMARFDNLGKGASGAVVQCMNVMCGFDEAQGTDVGRDSG
jgi:N-acetyl-gamma-glutamyl-phosphate reductase